ncbi:MAG: hypothetical protein ACJ790_05870 [Myxococcaceae bacterium]
MTDLPQHEAVTSILLHARSPDWGFAEFYRVDWLRTLYVLPYLLAMVLAKVSPLHLAMNLVVAVSVATIPIGTALLLRALKKPWPLAFLAFPFIYSAAFFWGFVNFLLALGLTLILLAVMIEPVRSTGRTICAIALLVAISLTHVYGLALFLGYCLLWAIVGDRQALWARRLEIGSSLPLVALWVWVSRNAQTYGGSYSPPLPVRLANFGRYVLGGYSDLSEPVLLGLSLLTALLLALLSAREVRDKTNRHALPLLGLFAGNLLLFFIAPQHTPTAKFIFFRHGVIALTLLPAIVPTRGLLRAPLLTGALLFACGVGAILNGWSHLWAFDREARSYDEAVAPLPMRQKLLYLDFDPNGEIMDSAPYLHQAAYAQAERGGYLAVTFPRMFWNLPVAILEQVPVPPNPPNLESTPVGFSWPAFHAFYDFVLIRGEAPYELGGLERVTQEGPWQLYRVVR